MNKNLWMRVGMSIKLTDSEVDLILSNGNDSAKILKKAIEEGRYCLDGESYVPMECVEDFNKTYGTNYECVDHEWYL